MHQQGKGQNPCNNTKTTNPLDEQLYFDNVIEQKSNNNDTVMLGEKNEYEPLSREAFVSKMNKKKN